MFLTNLSIKKKGTYFLTLILSIPNLVMANCSPAEDKSRIVAAGGSLTEIIFMLGLQNHLVGRDLTSTFPAEANDLPSIGYVRNLSIEGLLSLDPTLILAEEDAGPSLVINQVKRLSVDFRVLEDSLTPYGILDKVRCIGKILKVDDRTLSNVSKKISSSIETVDIIKREQRESSVSIALILMMRGALPVVAGTGTSGDAFLQMLGFKNAMREVEGWKPVGLEQMINSNPGYIIITKRGFRNFKRADDFFDQTGLIKTKAGKSSNLLVEDGMALLGFGPRTIDTAVNVLRQIESNVK